MVCWFMPVILATWELEIRRLMAQGQSLEKVSKPPPSQPIARCGGVCQSSQPCGKHKEEHVVVVQASS
jgi:hypothetical protein